MKPYCARIHAACFSKLIWEKHVLRCTTCGKQVISKLLQAVTNYDIKQLHQQFVQVGQPNLRHFNPKLVIHNLLFKLYMFDLCGDAPSWVPYTLHRVGKMAMYYTMKPDDSNTKFRSTYREEFNIVEFSYVNVTLYVGPLETMEILVQIDRESQDKKQHRCCSIM